jgi:hypothetical protein
MHDDAVQTTTTAFEPGPVSEPSRPWASPTVEVICLACEISAYAPDGDLPLF